MINNHPYWLVPGVKIFNLGSKNDVKYQSNTNYKRLVSKQDKTVIYIPEKQQQKIKG